jgi:biopolymer transport protein ExbD
MAAGPAIGGGGGRGRVSASQTVGVLNLLTDLAFNLLIFFVVCASTEPDQGRAQQLPSANKEKQNEQQAQNVKVEITRDAVKVNSTETPLENLTAKIKEELDKGKKEKPEDRIVIVSSAKDTTYAFWITVTGKIEQAGGVIVLQMEDEKEVIVR